MALDGPGGRAGHAADCARATLHAPAHERQRGPVFRKVSVATFCNVIVTSLRESNEDGPMQASQSY